MLYLVDGQPKSGSTFLFQLVKRLVQPDLGPDELQADAGAQVFHRRAGEATHVAFIVNHGAFADAARRSERWSAMLRERDAVFKLHRGGWLLKEPPAFEVTHFLTYRNVLDAALALLEQSEREASRRPERQRPAFLKLNDPEKALRQAIRQFGEIVVPALADKRIVSLAYPRFIEGDPVCCRTIAEACCVDPDTVMEQIRRLDREVRHGEVRAEFGTGVPGRGEEHRHRFPAHLVERAERMNAEYGL